MTQPQRPQPDLPTRLGLLLLVVISGLLIWPVFGGPLPSPLLVVGLLALRLALQVWRSRQQPEYRRPISWAFDLLLLGFLLWTYYGQR